jgi:hypothetical protein
MTPIHILTDPREQTDNEASRSASCAACGWQQNYTSSSSASRGRRRHRCGGVHRSWTSGKPREMRYSDGLYGGRWVLDPVRRVMVWEQQW